MILFILDPAYPGFTRLKAIDDRLDPSDAEFIDVIHTCSGILGHIHNLGHVDFYPNSGKPAQPGCGQKEDLVGGCSHSRSYEYFAESITSKNSFMARKCDKWTDFIANNCDDVLVPMGDPTPRTSRGSYYLETLKGPTFGKSL